MAISLRLAIVLGMLWLASCREYVPYTDIWCGCMWPELIREAELGEDI